MTPEKKDVEINMATAYVLGIIAFIIVGLVVYLFVLFLEWALA